MAQRSISLKLTSPLLLITSLPALGQTAPTLSDEGQPPIRIERAHKLFDQCSLQTPNPSGPLWLPTTSEIKAFEEALEEYLQGRKWSKDPRWTMGSYRGQHVGFGRGSNRYIYGNYFRSDIAKYVVSGNPIVFCDGGPSFWGILYNVETGELSGFSTNGR